MPNPTSQAEPVTGVEVALVDGPLANFGIASEAPVDSGVVSAQSLVGLGKKLLKTVSSTKFWEQVERATEVVDLLNTAVNL